MNTQSKRLGQRMAAEIRAELARQGRSRRWLAEQIGESHVTVGRWIKGETPLSLDALDIICRALSLTITDLLAAVERNGGYEPRVLVGADGCAIRDSNPEPADSVRVHWFGRTGERRGFMPLATPGPIPHPRRAVVVPLARRRFVLADNRAAS